MRYLLYREDKFIEERLALLKQAGLQFVYDEKTNSIELRSMGLSSGQNEILEFVKNMDNPIKLYLLDKSLCRSALELHYKFWKEKVDA